MADQDPRKRDVQKHLEFLGYTCEWQPDGWLYASHPVRWNIFVRPMPLGTLFHCSIRVGMLSDGKRLALLEFFNRLNATTMAVRFSLEREEPNGIHVLRARTLAPGDYQRRSFGAWIDLWHKELERLREGPSLDPEEEVEERRDKGSAGERELKIHQKCITPLHKRYESHDM